MRSRLAPAALLLCLQVPARAAPEAALDLANVFKIGPLLQDRNGDGVVDFVDAAIVLGEDPSPDDVIAAANVAARLGLETSALNLPLPRRAEDARVPILIGAGGRALPALKPGEGVLQAVEAAGKPALLIAGADAAGTQAAAEFFAARLPYAWDLRGATLEKVARDVRQALEAQGVSATSVALPAVLVQNGAAVSRLTARVAVGSTADVAKARSALQQAKLSYRGVESLRIELAPSDAAAVVIDVATAAPPDPPGPIGRRPGSGAKENLDLGTLYSIDGGLGDSDNNLIPDRADVVLVPAGAGIEALIDLAARIGLESTGISLPLVLPASAIDWSTPAADAPADTGANRPASLPTLVLIGIEHPGIERLIRDKKLERPALAPGEGLIHVVRGERRAIVVTGGDKGGLARAIAQLAERLPHLRDRGKDRTSIEDVEDDLRLLLSGRSPAGQAATALYKLDRLTAELPGKDLVQAKLTVAVEKAPEGLAELLRSEAAARLKADSLDVVVENLDLQKAKPVVLDGKPVGGEYEIPSEVDDFWKVLRARVLPAVRKSKGRPAVVLARLSEPPEIRRQLEREARAELLKAGAPEASTSVTLLSAYKQGYSWLYDVVRPALVDEAIDRITIRFAEIGPPPEWKHQTSYAPTRWLLEIYPIDEVLARELKLDLKQIVFEKMPIGSPAYQVSVTGKDGAELFRGSFQPKLVVRSFFDQFPSYEKARVTTGWLDASVDGKTVVDERIATDPERFWDIFQGKTLPALYEHVMRVGRGKPRPEDAPFFGELRVEVSLSEPEYLIGIDQEQISPMEALHEELYFNTLHFFDVFGRMTRGAPLAYPGRVIPVVRPKADGKPGWARISLTGFQSAHPGVVVEYQERSGRRGEVRLPVPKVALDRPQALAALVRAGGEGLQRLDVRVKVDSERDERSELIQRTSEDRVDRTILSAEQVRAVLANLGRLRAAGLYQDALAYHGLRELRVVAGWEHEPLPGSETVVSVDPNGRPADWPDVRKLLPAGYRHAGEQIVQWDTPIPPGEAYELLAKMSTFREATVYKAGESYLGRDIWAMDLMPPLEASHLSQAKASTFKPTVLYSARQHANEVSSTSHVLRLAELLLTDAEFRKKLDKVNVVIHPVTNPDGAQLAYDLHQITPGHMLHAGYLGSLGVDVTAGQGDPDPLYPETRVRPELWRTWLPDIFLNPHGYPHHEWVQLFSEYAAWVRTRAVETRDYWSMRGWWTPGFAWLDDPRYPRHKAEQFKIRGMIVENIKAAPDVVALNQRAYDRYARYTVPFDQKNFKLDFTDGVLMYTAIKGARATQGQGQGPGGGGAGGGFMTRNPNVTIWEGSTEAPDETASGDWLKLVATAGLQWDKAILEYLVTGNHVVDRRAEPFWGGVSLSMNRPRPPRPPRKEEP